MKRSWTIAMVLLLACVAIAEEDATERTGRRRGPEARQRNGERKGKAKCECEGECKCKKRRRGKHGDVMKSLNLTEEQKTQMRAAHKAAAEETKELKGPERRKAMHEKMQAAHDTILTEAQKTKLKEAREAQKKARAEAQKKSMAEKLGLTEDQQKKLADARKAAREATKGIEDREARRKAMHEKMKVAHESILTAEQKETMRRMHAKRKRGEGKKGEGKGEGEGKGRRGKKKDEEASEE